MEEGVEVKARSETGFLSSRAEHTCHQSLLLPKPVVAVIN